MLFYTHLTSVEVEHAKIIHHTYFVDVLYFLSQLYLLYRNNNT